MSSPAPNPAQEKLEQLCINTVRTLSMDAVQKANSGHPGTPMALAPLAFVLWDRFLRFNPRDPHWAGRDRFILSNGHASMLLYSMLYSDRLRPDARRLEELPAMGLKDAGTPGVRTHSRGGNHDRAAGARYQQLGGNGHRATLVRRTISIATDTARSITEFMPSVATAT